MTPARGTQAILRDVAQRDDPQSVLAYADMKAWELAEGLGSDAAFASASRTDWERIIPGLPARGTYKAIGLGALATFAIVTGLSYLSSSEAMEAARSHMTLAIASLGSIAAAWSIASEIRGWEGSDAATWHAKAHAKAFEKRIGARRPAMRDRLIAISGNRLVIYQMKDGMVFEEAFVSSEIDDLSLECGSRHMVLRLATRIGSICFDWLPCDAVFEAAVERLAAAVSRPVERGAVIRGCCPAPSEIILEATSAITVQPPKT